MSAFGSKAVTFDTVDREQFSRLFVCDGEPLKAAYSVSGRGSENQERSFRSFRMQLRGVLVHIRALTK